MRKEFVRWGQTWLDHHPGWIMKTWTEENLPTTEYPQQVAKSVSLAQQSNIHRYEVLYREGGVYIDTDFECLKNIEPLIDELSAFTGYMHLDKDGEISMGNGIFGVTPYHPLLQDLLDGIPTVDVTKNLTLSPRYFTAAVRRHPEVLVFDKNVFYPVLNEEIKQPGNLNIYPEESYADHHWAHAWTDSFRDKNL